MIRNIVRGNDFTFHAQVRALNEGAIVPVDLIQCENVTVSLVGDFGSYPLPYRVSDTDGSVLFCDVPGDLLPRGLYSVDVCGELYGIRWRSVRSAQINIVEIDSDADESGLEEDGAIIRIGDIVVGNVVLSLLRASRITKEEYEELENPDEDTLYVITE